MTFLTEEEDNVNATYTESINELMARARRAHESRIPQPWRGMIPSQGEAYWPKNPEASNHPVDDYKWVDRYDHPKD